MPGFVSHLQAPARKSTTTLHIPHTKVRMSFPPRKRGVTHARAELLSSFPSREGGERCSTFPTPLSDRTLLHPIRRDVSPLPCHVFQRRLFDVCQVRRSFEAPSASFPRIHRSLHPYFGAVLESFHFILTTSRNARCLERFSPRVSTHSLCQREQHVFI